MDLATNNANATNYFFVSFVIFVLFAANFLSRVKSFIIEHAEYILNKGEHL